MTIKAIQWITITKMNDADTMEINDCSNEIDNGL